MNVKKVIVLDDYQGCVLSLASWDNLAPDATVSTIREHFANPEQLAKQLDGANVIVANRERTTISADLINAIPSLELIVTLGMRNSAIDVAAASERGITVCGTQTFAHPTAELTWGMILAMARNLPEEVASLRAGRWQTDRLGFLLRGRRLGIVGLGRIGKEVARYAVAFGMDVVAWSRSLTEERAAEAGARSVDAETLWRESDIITLHVPLTPQTKGLISDKEIGLMKNTVRLVNTSRAEVIDETALIQALESGRIAGAAIDVFKEEPIPSDDPLLRAPNLLLTPHLGYVAQENYELAYGQVVEDIRAWLDGSPVKVINPPA